MKVSIRDEKVVRHVIDLCDALEEKGLSIYETLLNMEEDEKLRDLWSTLMADEKDHRHYWKRMKEVCDAGGVPEIFEEPKKYVDELRVLMTRLDHLAEKVKEDNKAPAVFIHALKLEFLLLHPSFVTLFHYLPETSDVSSPRRTYEQHLGKILTALMDYEELPPEMELLGEVIGQVWKKSEEGAVRAVTDLLTGTYTRRGLYIAMKPIVYLARRDRETAGIMIMEISNLKEINKRYGHKVGDEILAATAGAVSSRMRSSDVFGRFGGDDFLALLTRFDRRHFESIGNEITRRAGEVAVGDARPVLNIGGAFTVMGEDVEGQLDALIRGADYSLAAAREGEKGCVVREF